LFTFKDSSISFVKNVSVNIPKNRKVFSKQEAAFNKFFIEIRSLLLNISPDVLRLLLICGPGSTKNMFITWMQTNQYKVIDPKNSTKEQQKIIDFERWFTLPSEEVSRFENKIWSTLSDRLIILKTTTADKSALEMLLEDEWKMNKL